MRQIMKHATLGIVAAVVLLHVSGAHAQLSYSYVRGAYLVHRADSDLGTNLDGRGPEIGVSYEILPFLHAFADYHVLQLDDFDVETDTSKAGVGFDLDLSPDQSVYFDFAALRQSADTGGSLGATSASNDGYGVSIGYREKNQTRLEFDARADYIKISDSDYTDTSVAVSLLYELRRNLKIEGLARFGGDDEAYGIGIRYYLPTRSGRSR
jgi:predicted porin